jgi:hypothetical protein
MAIQMTDPCPKQPVTPGETTSDQLDNSPVTADHAPAPKGPAKPPAPGTVVTAAPDKEESPVQNQVEVRDHRGSNPANWSKEEWMAAIKQDPGKYGPLFAEMNAAGTLREGVADEKMMQFVGLKMQEFNRAVTLLHDILQAKHETLKEAARIRV